MLQDLNDHIIDFEDKKLLALMGLDEGLIKRLDGFFSKKCICKDVTLACFVNALYEAKGQVSIAALILKHNISLRTLERQFKQNIGIPPKELSNIIRFQSTLKKLKTNAKKESLLRVAYEMGYYDHAHLTNEFKKYAGLNPTQLDSYGR